MFKIFLAAAALSLMAAGSPAYAQAKACKKVDISWTCRIRGSGSGKFPCRGGESEAACCKRWKANPHWCAGRNGGLAKFKCACPKKGEGGRKPGGVRPGGAGKGGTGRKPGGATIPTEILQLDLAGPAPGPVQPPPRQEEKREPVETYDPRFGPRPKRGSDEGPVTGKPPRSGPSVPGVRGGSRLPNLSFGRGGRKCSCKKVRVEYSCTNGDYGNTERTCRKNESEAACCARHKRRVCSRSRLIEKKWHCKCVKWRKCRTGATFRRR